MGDVVGTVDEVAVAVVGENHIVDLRGGVGVGAGGGGGRMGGGTGGGDMPPAGGGGGEVPEPNCPKTWAGKIKLMRIIETKKELAKCRRFLPRNGKRPFIKRLLSL